MQSNPENLNALPAGYKLEEFELRRVLGAGSFGITYQAYDTHLAQDVAIKEYLPRELAVRVEGTTVLPQSESEKSTFEWGLDRFLDEARTLAKFRHPAIIKVFRFFRAHGTGYIVMDYADGETLSAYLKREGPLDGERLDAILKPLMSGVAAVHEAGILHRDIKPDNVLMRKDGSPVLIDFGAARQAFSNRTQLTAVYTPRYAPVEQCLGVGEQGPWTDIYALGAVAYQAMQGEMPIESAARFRKDKLVPLAECAAGKAPASYLAAIDAAMAVSEADRPQSIAEWRALMDSEAPTDMEAPTVLLSPGTDPASLKRKLRSTVPSPTGEDKAAGVEPDYRGRTGAGNSNRTGAYVAGGLGVLALAAVLGWAGLTYLPGPAYQGGEQNGASGSPVSGTAAGVEAWQLQSLVGFWRAARLAREAIDSDLAVSLSEFEAAGMVDAAATARKAIAVKTEAVEQAKARYGALMKDVTPAYADDPEAVMAVFETYLESPQMRSDPDASAFLRQTAQALEESATTGASLEDHYAGVFSATLK